MVKQNSPCLCVQIRASFLITKTLITFSFQAEHKIRFPIKNACWLWTTIWFMFGMEEHEMEKVAHHLWMTPTTVSSLEPHSLQAQRTHQDALYGSTIYLNQFTLFIVQVRNKITRRTRLIMPFRRQPYKFPFRVRGSLDSFLLQCSFWHPSVVPVMNDPSSAWMRNYSGHRDVINASSMLFLCFGSCASTWRRKGTFCLCS